MARFVTLLFAALALALALPGGGATAQDGSPGLTRITSQGTLRVGMSGTQPPLNFRDKEGTPRGLDVDLAKSLAGIMQVDLEIVHHPFGKLLEALDAGEVDLVISGMTITPERSVRAAFVGPYLLSGKSILTKSSTLAQVERIEGLDQENLKLAALAGSTSESFVKRSVPKASLVATEDYDAAVALLLAGEVDAMVADREIVALTAFLNPKEGLATLRQPLTIEPIGIASPASDPLLAAYLENAVDALEASGVMATLRSRWLEDSSWVSQLP